MKSIYLLLLSSLLFISCRSGRSMQMEIQKMRSDLFYELTSPEYFGEKHKTVYLDFIKYSNLDYYTTVKKKGGYVIPLLLYNVEVNKFRVRLGEGSLQQTYREFLTDALLTECNSSTHFHLIDDRDEVITDSTYHLNIKIVRNETNSQVTLRNNTMLLFEGEVLEFDNNKVGGANTALDIEVSLLKDGNKMFEKMYSMIHYQEGPQYGFEDSVQSNEACLFTMTESLSQATKKIVENISQELDMLLVSY